MKRQRGAALLVILMIAGVMGAYFAMSALTGASADRDKVMATTLSLAQARDALIGFALVNGRLPCPAMATETVTLNPLTVGREPSLVIATGCTNLAGVLPWATLGVNETDAWGNRLTYRVTQEFTRTVPQLAFASCAIAPSPTPTQAAFALCSQGDMTVLSTGGVTLASTVPAIVISHGKNGSGAYNTTGKQVPISTDADEIENSNGDINFVSKTPTTTFDDIVSWVPLNILLFRTQKAGKLP